MFGYSKVEKLEQENNTLLRRIEQLERDVHEGKVFARQRVNSDEVPIKFHDNDGKERVLSLTTMLFLIIQHLGVEIAPVPRPDYQPFTLISKAREKKYEPT